MGLDFQSAHLKDNHQEGGEKFEAKSIGGDILLTSNYDDGFTSMFGSSI